MWYKIVIAFLHYIIAMSFLFLDSLFCSFILERQSYTCAFFIVVKPITICDIRSTAGKV